MHLVPISKAAATEIYSDDELFERISCGDVPKDGFELVDTLYLGMFTDNGLVGCWQVDIWNENTFQIHCNLLIQYRTKYAKDAGKAIYKWFLETNDFKHKLIAQVPVVYQDVCRYCEKHNMHLEGVIREGVMVKGEFVDINLYGITKDEVQEFLNE